MSIESLRELALYRNSKREFAMTICLDDDALSAYHAEIARIDKLPEPKSMADKPVDKQVLIDKAEAALPRESLIEIVFHPVAPVQYEKLVEESSDARGQLDFRAFYPAILSACYSQARDMDGNDLGLSWEEVRDNTLTSSDYDECVAGVVRMHRSGQAVHFGRASSGPAEQR